MCLNIIESDLIEIEWKSNTAHSCHKHFNCVYWGGSSLLSTVIWCCHHVPVPGVLTPLCGLSSCSSLTTAAQAGVAVAMKTPFMIGLAGGTASGEEGLEDDGDDDGLDVREEHGGRHPHASAGPEPVQR